MVRFIGVETKDCPQVLGVTARTRWLSSVLLRSKSWACLGSTSAHSEGQDPEL